MPTNLLLFLDLVGGSKVVKKLAIHLHKGLQDVVDKRHNSSDEEKVRHPIALFIMTLEIVYFNQSLINALKTIIYIIMPIRVVYTLPGYFY